MPEAEHKDFTTPQMSDQNGKDSCDKQTAVEHTVELNCGSLCSEPSEQKLEVVLVPNEKGEIRSAISNDVDMEELLLTTEDVTENVVIEHFGPLSEDGGNRETGKESWDELITSVQGFEFGCISASNESLKRIHHHNSELVASVPVETSDAVSHRIVIEQEVPPSEDKNKDSVIEQFELSPVDISKSSLAETDSLPKQITADQGDNHGSESIHSEPSEHTNQLASEPVQSETERTSSAVAKCVSVEQLESPSEGLTISTCTESTVVPPEDGTGLEKLASPSEDKSKLSPVEALTISSLIESTGVRPEDVTCTEKLASPSDDKSKDFLIEQLELAAVDASKSHLAETDSCPESITSKQKHELDSGSVHIEPSEQKNQIASDTEPMQSEKVDMCYVSGLVAVERLEPPSEVLTIDSLVESKGLPLEDLTKTPSPELPSPSQNGAKDSSIKELETAPKDTIECSSPSGSRDKKSSKALKKKRRLKPLVDSSRVLRPRSQEKPKPPEPSNDLVNDSIETKGEKKKKKKKKLKKSNVAADEFLKIRQRLRYLQNRINYERSLIDAYSGEGWKGLSMEKLKPEKELQRASSEILRRKLKIRDLFQHIDSLCAEGRIPESLFDSEGEISSEDIFCAKCGSKDVSLDNDIILCDGACERGFHQFCLEPPLRKEDIPPDDEGWLCPGCDCKVDCIDLLNDSQGTNLLVTDSWEKVFPEVAATSGQNQDHNFGLPSDDSEDDDYDPDGLEIDEKNQGDVGSSDESQYTTASDDLETTATEEQQYLGLPSDDSEDDDYDPSALEPEDDKVKHESSSSDFTSDSEDLGAALDDATSIGIDEDPACSSLGSIKSRIGSDGRRSNVGRKKKQLVNEDLSSLLESDLGEEGSAPVSGKRRVERLDYKKLHDEEYGNVPTDSSDDEMWTEKETGENVSSGSSDDESWTDTVAPRKRKKTTGEVTPGSLNGEAPILKDESNAKDVNHDQVEPERTYKKRTRQKRNSEHINGSPAKKRSRQKKISEDANGSPATPDKDSLAPGSSGKRAKSSASRRLGEAATQKLYKSFKENQYPDRATKEKLAAEAEMTVQQVSKWFDNARWSFRHSSCPEPCSTACAARYFARKKTETNDKPPEPASTAENTPTPNTAENAPTPETSTAAPESTSGGGGKLVSPGSSGKGSKKRKGKLSYQEPNNDSTTSAKGRKIQTRGRKSTS